MLLPENWIFCKQAETGQNRPKCNRPKQRPLHGLVVYTEVLVHCPEVKQCHPLPISWYLGSLSSPVVSFYSCFNYIIFLTYLFKLEHNYFTILWWPLPYINMNLYFFLSLQILPASPYASKQPYFDIIST